MWVRSSLRCACMLVPEGSMCCASNSAVRPDLAASNRGVGGPLFLELDVPVQMHRLVLEVAKEVELVLKVGIERVGARANEAALAQREYAFAAGLGLAEDDKVRVRGAIRVEHGGHFRNSRIEGVAEAHDAPGHCGPHIRVRQGGKRLVEGR